MTDIDLMVLGRLIVTMEQDQPLIEHGAVAIDKGRIVAIGPRAAVEPHFQVRKTIDGAGKVVMPGLVDTHHHFLQNFHKGTRDDLSLVDWIDQVSVPRIKVAVQDYLAGSHAAQMHSSRLGCVDAIRAGITTILNMEWATDPSVVDVFEQAGLRVVHTLTMTDQWISPDVLLPHATLYRLADELRQRCAGSAGGRVTFRYGLACPNSCSVELIREVRRRADREGIAIHIHIAESEYEWHNIAALYGATPTRHLHNLGLLGADVLGAHCIWLSDQDIELFARTGTKVAHNPECNMKIADGAAPIQKMLDAGIVVSLGTDSCAVNDNMDMFEVMRTAAFLQKVTVNDPRVLPAPVTLRMATLDGARALGMEQEIGSLAPGKKADLIQVDLSGAHMRPINRIENSLVYCASSHDVLTVICDGRVLMEQRRLQTLDEESWVAGAISYAEARFTEAGIELPPYFNPL